MKHDIAGAYNAEKEYLADKNPGKVQLIDRLIHFGYSSLTEYFSDRREYLILLDNVQIKHYLLSEVKSKILCSIQNAQSGAFAVDEDCIWVCVGDDYIDESKAKQLNVKLCKLGYNGGNIITSNSDFNVAINFRHEVLIDSMYYLKKMNDFLVSRGFDTHIDRNDIMYDNKKIAGSSLYSTDKSDIFFMSLSLTDHSYLIEQLCEKERKKTPGFLIGITKHEIEQEVNRWLIPNI